MNRLQALHKADQLATSVLEDLSNLTRALEEWPQPNSTDHNLLESVRWQITYIYNDADIRAKEPDYEKAQLEQLRCLKNLIVERLHNLDGRSLVEE